MLNAVHAHARCSSAGPFIPSWPPLSTRSRRELGLPSARTRTRRTPPEPGPKGPAFASPSPASTLAVAGRRELGYRSSHVSGLINMTGSPRALSDVYTKASKSTLLVSLGGWKHAHTHLRKTNTGTQTLRGSLTHTETLLCCTPALHLYSPPHTRSTS